MLVNAVPIAIVAAVNLAASHVPVAAGQQPGPNLKDIDCVCVANATQQTHTQSVQVCKICTNTNADELGLRNQIRSGWAVGGAHTGTN